MSRLTQLVTMFSSITGETEDNAKKAILSTPTGQAISQSNPAYLYDQQTSNLAEIASELPTEIGKKFTKAAIMQSMKILAHTPTQNPSRINIKSNPAGKVHINVTLKQRNCATLRAAQHQMNALKRSSKYGN